MLGEFIKAEFLAVVWSPGFSALKFIARKPVGASALTCQTSLLRQTQELPHSNEFALHENICKNRFVVM